MAEKEIKNTVQLTEDENLCIVLSIDKTIQGISNTINQTNNLEERKQLRQSLIFHQKVQSKFL